MPILSYKKILVENENNSRKVSYNIMGQYLKIIMTEMEMTRTEQWEILNVIATTACRTTYIWQIQRMTPSLYIMYYTKYTCAH